MYKEINHFFDIEDKIKVTTQVTTEVIAVRRGAKEVAGIEALSKIKYVNKDAPMVIIITITAIIPMEIFGYEK